MATITEVLAAPRPASIAQARALWPARPSYHASPTDWRRECLYFLLPDRFSDENAGRPLLDREHLDDARGGGWDDAAWSAYAYSGRNRFQGGTLRGAAQRLDYLAGLGVSTLWIGPVWKQRREAFVNEAGEDENSYHGYAIQDFLDVDPRFGSRADLVDLVEQAHAKGLRVVLDMVINHTARNFLYSLDGNLLDLSTPTPFTGSLVYGFGAWLDGAGQPVTDARALRADDAVWPLDLQDPDVYHRRGEIQNYDDHVVRPDGTSEPNMADDAQFRLGDMTNRDLALEQPGSAGHEPPLQVMIACWTYWMALTDCDGFRVDTLKHVRVEDARLFSTAVKEFAESLGKDNFLLVGEVAGGDDLEDAWLQALGWNLTAALELGSFRSELRAAATGDLRALDTYLARYQDPLPGQDVSQRVMGASFVTTVDDHDDVGVSPFERFPALSGPDGTPGDRAVADFYEPLRTVPASALLLFSLGVPCLYYGAEQGLSGPAMNPRDTLRAWDKSGDGRGADRWLREAMFGPEHPRPSGTDGIPDGPGDATTDPGAPGFGPFGTSGAHVFDEGSPQYLRTRLLLTARRSHPALQSGRQYARPATALGEDPVSGGPVAGVVAWSRILAGQEVVVVVNTGLPGPGGVDVQVLVDAGLNPDGSQLRVVASTADVDRSAPDLTFGSLHPVKRPPGAAASVTLHGLPAHEVVVLTGV